MKKVIIISSSPREGGNSYKLCEEFKKGAEKSGNEVELISLADKKIKYCIACETCAETGKCIHEDGMDEILSKIIDADVLVFATPIYFYDISGQLKTFIDRTLPRFEEIENKDFYFIGSCSDRRQEAFDSALETIQGFLDSVKDVELKGVVYGKGAFELGEIDEKPSMQEAYEMGKNI